MLIGLFIYYAKRLDGSAVDLICGSKSFVRGAKSMRLQLGKGSYRIRVIEQAPHKNSDFGTSVI